MTELTGTANCAECGEPITAPEGARGLRLTIVGEQVVIPGLYVHPGCVSDISSVTLRAARAYLEDVFFPAVCRYAAAGSPLAVERAMDVIAVLDVLGSAITVDIMEAARGAHECPHHVQQQMAAFN